MTNFLESINDYLHLKQALSVAAQRIEGYKIEGLSEEIDKVNKRYNVCTMFAQKKSLTERSYPQHVRELCYFDLTSPMRGVGPNVIRTLLQEETLKVKTRKDSKASDKTKKTYMIMMY